MCTRRSPLPALIAHKAPGARIPTGRPLLLALPLAARHSIQPGMSFTIATWNINSVRLRIGNVIRLLEAWKPDVLCLQETKCPQGQFPSGPLSDIGYRYIAERGQAGYHGVAIISRLPFEAHSVKTFCGKDDCRHVSATFAASRPLIVHNLYVPAGGDEPDPEINEKFAHKLKFVDELEHWFANGAVAPGHHGLVLGDLNIA